MTSLREAREANVWEETATGAPAVPGLDGESRAQVLVVGAGYLGMSAALHLAAAGVETIVLDRNEPGSGASGRNGGQVIPGLKHDPAELEAMFGVERGERLWRFAGSTADVVFDLIARHGLRCGARRAPWIQGVHSVQAASRARQRVDDWQRRGANVEYIDRTRTAQIAGTDLYLGAFVDHRAGALQPLSYARELARVAIAAGAKVHRDAHVTALVRDGGRWCAITSAGARVHARTVLLATNAYSDGLVPGLARSIVSLNSLQIATAPIPAASRAALLRNGETLADTRRVIRYWRLDDEGRLLMGGRGPYRDTRDANDWGHLAAHIRRYFPGLADVPITHRWGGRVAVHVDYMPRLHRPRPDMLTAIGCQGRGVAWQTAMGVELAKLVLDPDYDAVLPVTPVRPIPFHPLKAAGVASAIALWRALDRLGVS